VIWITIKTTSSRWEAEWMQQMLAAHEIPARVVSQSVVHLGQAAAGLQVQPQDRWTAMLLLSPVEESEDLPE
jgi:hypothetical protein